MRVWKTGLVPAEWHEGIIVSLYKGKGLHNNCGSYRLISLLSVARLQPLLTARRRQPKQSGFTPGRSTIEAILALRLLSELHQEFSQPSHVAYIDIKAAFDSVDQSALWKALRSHGAPPFLIQLIEDLHAGMTSRTRVGGQLSEPFVTTSGVQLFSVLPLTEFSPDTDAMGIIQWARTTLPSVDAADWRRQWA